MNELLVSVQYLITKQHRDDDDLGVSGGGDVVEVSVHVFMP